MNKRLDRPSGALGVLLLDVKQVAAICNLGVSTIWKLAKENETFPKPKYFGPKTARWSYEDIRKWANSL